MRTAIMLLQLRIADMAVIESLEIELSQGLNVITGETGAGKSMIVGAADLLRGERASADRIRAGATEATVEALFAVDHAAACRAVLREAGIKIADGELLVRRTVAANGRSKVYLNGSMSTATVLQQVTSTLLEIAGQNEAQLLCDRTVQRRLLDAVALTPTLSQSMQHAYSQLTDAVTQWQQLQLDETQRQERIEFLQHQLDELSAARLVVGEDEVLTQQRQRLVRATELLDVSSYAERVLYSEEGAVAEVLAGCAKRLSDVSAVDEKLGQWAAALDEARLSIEDVAQSIRRYADHIDSDPVKLAQLEERVDLIYKLKRKHGGSIEAILQRQAAMQLELDHLTNHDAQLVAVTKTLQQAQQEAIRIAQTISTERKKSADKLAQQIQRALADLHMKGSRLVIELTPLPPKDRKEVAGTPWLNPDGRRLSSSGWDRVEFLIAPNAGEPPKPLAKIASGGERSRIMLALRQVLGKYDPVRTSIYDEVDAGIGGAAADAVGKSLARASEYRQVICVTHLPQVAAYADRHFFIGKATVKGRTMSQLRQMNDEDRIEELARMLGASRITEQARANAKQLIIEARGQAAQPTNA